MSFSQAQIRRALMGKVGLKLETGARHPVFSFWHDGELIAKTHISHGSNKAVSAGVVSAMARQLGVTGPQLRDCIACRIDGETLVGLILKRATDA